MEEEKRAYREGHEPSPDETVGTPEDEFEDSIMEAEAKVKPLTAILVAKFEDRVEVVSEIPGMDMGHVASLSEIRDMANIVSNDAMLTLTANRAAQVFTQSLIQATASKQQQDRLVTPIGVNLHRRKR